MRTAKPLHERARTSALCPARSHCPRQENGVARRSCWMPGARSDAQPRTGPARPSPPLHHSPCPKTRQKSRDESLFTSLCFRGRSGDKSKTKCCSFHQLQRAAYAVHRGYLLSFTNTTSVTCFSAAREGIAACDTEPHDTGSLSLFSQDLSLAADLLLQQSPRYSHPNVTRSCTCASLYLNLLNKYTLGAKALQSTVLETRRYSEENKSGPCPRGADSTLNRGFRGDTPKIHASLPCPILLPAAIPVPSDPQTGGQERVLTCCLPTPRQSPKAPPTGSGPGPPATGQTWRPEPPRAASAQSHRQTEEPRSPPVPEMAPLPH